MQIYALVVDVKGMKLKTASADAVSAQHLAADGRNLEISNPSATLQYIAGAIGMSRLGRPIIDKTGVAGPYDFKLVFTPDTPANRRTSDPRDVTIFTAVQEQLGLKLQSAKGTVHVLVADHIEKPSEN